jgi:hypothetical protein
METLLSTTSQDTVFFIFTIIRISNLTVTNVQITLKVGNFLTTQATISFSRGTLFHIVSQVRKVKILAKKVTGTGKYLVTVSQNKQ